MWGARVNKAEYSHKIEAQLRQNYPLAHAICASWHPSRHLIAAGLKGGTVALLFWNAESQLLEMTADWDVSKVGTPTSVVWGRDGGRNTVTVRGRGGQSTVIDASGRDEHGDAAAEVTKTHDPALVSFDGKFELESWGSMGMRVVRREG